MTLAERVLCNCPRLPLQRFNFFERPTGVRDTPTTYHLGWRGLVMTVQTQSQHQL